MQWIIMVRRLYFCEHEICSSKGYATHCLLCCMETEELLIKDLPND